MSILTQYKTLKIDVLGHELLLHPLKFVYWQEKEMLICADLHIGKGRHFTNGGITMPGMLNRNNFWRLSAAFALYKPKVFMVLGDMVHSVSNPEWDEFYDFLDNYPQMKRILVRGNHELYDDATFQNFGFDVHHKLVMEHFVFTHEPMEQNEIGEDLYNMCGHVHPAIRMHGDGRQSLRAACFWFGAQQAVLPAFGEFTGTYTIKPKREDRVFVVAENEVISVTA
jgi:uncharacterized protein